MLWVAVHLCLGNRLPARMVQKRRPFMLEPYLWRVEGGVVQERRATCRVFRCAVPLKHYTNSGQLSGPTLYLAYD